MDSALITTLGTKMRFGRDAQGSLMQTVFSREFFLYASSSAFVAWRLELFQLDGTALGIGPGWLQNAFEAAAVMVAAFVSLFLVTALSWYPLAALFPDVLSKDENSSGVRLERLIAYGFIVSCVWVLLLG